MKCTGDEWDHCRVEKMGCEGCYYNEMKLEEAIKTIKEIIYDSAGKPVNYIDITFSVTEGDIGAAEFIKAIEIVLKELENKNKEIEKLKKENTKKENIENDELKKILESKNKIKVLNFKGGI